MLYLLFSFRGRINRKQYWFGMLLVGFGSFVGQIATQAIAVGEHAAAHTPAEKFAAFSSASALMLPVSALTLWASVAVQFKRLHDRGRPGWISFVPLVVTAAAIVTVITDIVSGVTAPALLGDIVNYLAVLGLMSLALFVDLGCMASKEGPNKYGDPPGSPGSGVPYPVPSGPNPKQFVGVQGAMDRAIAARDAVPAAQIPRAPGAQPSFATPQAAPAGAAARAFGRRATR